RPSLRGPTAASTEGGLARMYTTINEIRARRTKDKTLLLNTGDTIQGSAEALFTKGGALVDVLNRFEIDAYAPGNWDWVYEIDGVKIGILGFTSDRGPQVVGRGVTKGIRFTKGDEEIKELVALLRQKENVTLVVMLSELGLSNNIRLAEKTPGVDVILSSDM